MRLISILLPLICSSLCLFAQDHFHDHPRKVKLVTEDVPRFWRMMDRLTSAETKNDSIRIIQQDYLGKASIGLQQLMNKKNYAFTAEDMYYTIIAYNSYLKSIRGSSLQINAYKGKIMKAFGNLKSIYDAARFPDFYFAMGVFNSGGTGIPSGMFIGAEIETAAPNSPLEKLPRYLQTGIKTVDQIHLICAHELIHFQQHDHVIDLLGAAIHEGVCDFIGELISGGLINQYQLEYGNQHETDLWVSFKKEMYGQDYSNWLYNGSKAVDMPADMGYYIGYKICSTYYAKARDKKQALTELLQFSSAQAILDKSGYNGGVVESTRPIENNFYLINGVLLPEKKRISFHTVLNVTASKTLPDTLLLLLHKDSKIQQILLNGQPARFSLASSEHPANRYMPESRFLYIIPEVRYKGSVNIDLKYETDFRDLKQNNSNFSEEWISLASYSSWYPVNFEWGHFSYDVNIQVPKGFQVSGTGKMTFKNGMYRLSESRKVSDIVLICSDKLKTRQFTDKSASIRMDYLGYTDAAADSIIEGTVQSYQYFQKLFGEIDSAKFTIVSTSLKGNSAFSRTDFIYLQTMGQTGTNILKTISHEIAHFWWNKSKDSWEDWLSESFAEFSTLLFVRKFIGVDTYELQVEDYRKQAEGLEPVWGFDRSSSEASRILYYKGAVILHDFMNYLGEENFFMLLASIHRQDIDNTDKLLQLINKTVSKEAANRLEALLKDKSD